MDSIKRCEIRVLDSSGLLSVSVIVSESYVHGVSVSLFGIFSRSVRFVLCFGVSFSLVDLVSWSVILLGRFSFLAVSTMASQFIVENFTSENLCHLSSLLLFFCLAVDLDQPLFVVLATVVAEVQVGFMDVTSNVGDDDGGGRVGGWWWW
ncbi:hypothetical protein DVH24_024235 [Malus domestica]|uniref:Transmembrane protein n=1 Tax=Malus domestica TaxID=3750 RepID=A0A498JML3_MALDO|nr:hypothetical protein DVH24_024235 [Malus domestica]